MRYITTTKNLFDKSFFSSQYDVANATLIEVKEKGWIVQGNSGGSPGNNSYSNGWFRPGYTRYDIDNIGMLLPKAGKVTVSAYYTVLENNSIGDANIYLYGKKNKNSTYLPTLPDVGIKTRRYVTYDINDGEEGIYYPIFTLNSSKILIEDIQVEYGDTPTDYVPYGYLPMYKGRYKVSDYCQLLDKSKYPATQTINGVTFTNNGDGSITANGTATKNTNLRFGLDVPYPKNHITLIIGCPSDGTGTTYYIITTFGNDYGKGLIKKQDKNLSSGSCYIAITANTVVSNIIFKPQLFDLTEMYGAGNEPTTVEEFREKFPNESYPYSPYCWAKMKQLRYITTTKNLFDNIVPANNCRVSFATSRAIATQIVADTDTLGLFKIVSYNGSSYEVLSWIRDVLTLGRITGTFTTPETTGYKHILFGLNGAKIDTTCLCEINLKPLTTYTFSCNFTNITQGSISWTDMQLEEGSTATPYVPYGYLSLK